MHMNDEVFVYQLESFHLLPDKPQGLLSFCEISNLTMLFFCSIDVLTTRVVSRSLSLVREELPWRLVCHQAISILEISFL